MKMTINFREELELFPVDLRFMLNFDGTGIIHKEYYRMNRNFLRQLQHVEKQEHEKLNSFQSQMTGAEAPVEKAEEKKNDPVPGKKKDENLIRYNLTVFDLKKNFNYSSW